MPNQANRSFSALFVAGKIAAYIVIQIILLFALSPLVNSLPLPVPKGFNFAISGLLAAIATNWICMRLFEHTGLLNIGLHWSGRNLMLGLCAGISSALLVTLLPVATGMAELRTVPFPSANLSQFAILAAVFFVAAAYEEICFRGYLFQLLMRGTGLIPAAVLTALLFASGHLGNPNASKLGVVNTFIAGFALACAFRSSGDLWFPIGIHYGWNTWLAISGADVSGFAARMTNYEMVWKVGPLWSGGGYGPEGGLLTTAAFSLWLLWGWKAPLQRRLPWMLIRHPESLPDLPHPGERFPSDPPPGALR